MPHPLTDDFDPADRACYPHWSQEAVRYSDQDPLGHVNNNAFGAFFETARLALFRDTRLRDGDAANQVGVVRRLEIDFLRELTWPNTVEIGTRVTRIGTTSFSYRQAVFVGPVCHALALTTSVAFDLESRAKVALTDGQKQRLADVGVPGRSADHHHPADQ